MLALLMLSVVLLASSRATDFTPCDNEQNGAIESVDVDGCDGHGACSVKVGGFVGISVTFTTTLDAKIVYAEMGVDLTNRNPSFLYPNNACAGGVTCPVTSGESYTFTGKFFVSTQSQDEVDGYFFVAKSPEQSGDSYELIGCAKIPYTATTE